MKRPLVAIVGRPNVGKSTLFNRLAHKRRAIVHDLPGVTRDRHYADTRLGDREVMLIDTGGFVPDDKHDDAIAKAVRAQAQAAVEECQVVLFVIDARIGVTAADEEVARYLRKAQRPMVLVGNKVDDARKGDEMIAELHRLGLGAPVALSAEHGTGAGELIERIEALLPEAEPEVEVPEDDDAIRPVKVAIVGRPNVGKSTLVNALIGTERLVTSPVAGTTRDPIDSHIASKDGEFILTDTAGIRRKAVISQKVEQFSVLGALKVIDECDVAALVLDATEPAVDQDARIAGIAEDKGRPLIIVVNKWDLKRGEAKEDAFREQLKYLLKWVAYAPVIFVSAKEKLKVGKVLEVARELHTQSTKKAGTPMLNRLLKHVTTEHPLPFAHGKALKLYYVAQVGTKPPAFQFVCNMPAEIPDRYKRYLLNQLRETFNLKVPVRLLFKERPGKGKRESRVGHYKGVKKHRFPKARPPRKETT